MLSLVASPNFLALLAIFLVLAWSWNRFSTIPLPDTSTLSTSRQTKLQGTAVVIGGSISGIITARVCADHFEQVLVVDPEFSAALKGARKRRIMQLYSTHFFLFSGIIALRRLWPDIGEHVRETGGFIADAKARMVIDGRPVITPWKSPDDPARPKTYFIQRATIETILERLLIRDCSNVRVIDGTARHITCGKNNSLVEALTVRGLDGSIHILKDSAVVVDCSGTARAGAKMLKSSGITIPDSSVSHYHPHMHYSTAVFSPSADVLAKLPIPVGSESCGYLYVRMPTPGEQDPKAVFFVRYEKNLVCLCFGGRGNATIPRQPNEIMSCLTQSDIPDWVLTSINMLVETSPPTLDFANPPPCVWTHFEEIHDLPSNFIAIGDTTLNGNPLNGQGMTVAILSATILNNLLSTFQSCEDVQAGIGRKYFKAMSPINRDIWAFNKIGDYGFSTTDPSRGESPSYGSFSRWLNPKIAKAATKDEEIARRLVLVQQLIEPRSSLITFRVLCAVLKDMFTSLLSISLEAGNLD